MAGMNNTALVHPMAWAEAIYRSESLWALGAFAGCLVLAWLMTLSLIHI